jgi:hypothetical protein
VTVQVDQDTLTHLVDNDASTSNDDVFGTLTVI